jgi:hypothetical protein
MAIPQDFSSGVEGHIPAQDSARLVEEVDLVIIGGE